MPDTVINHTPKCNMMGGAGTPPPRPPSAFFVMHGSGGGFDRSGGGGEVASVVMADHKTNGGNVTRAYGHPSLSPVHGTSWTTKRNFGGQQKSPSPTKN